MLVKSWLIMLVNNVIKLVKCWLIMLVNNVGYIVDYKVGYKVG